MIGKKGSALDILLIAVVLLVFAVVILIGFKVMNSVNTEFQASDLITDNAKTASTQLTNFYPGVIDNTFLFLTIGLAIVTLISAALVKVHPMFVILFIILLIILIFVSGVMSNVYQEMAATGSLVTEANLLTNISFVMEYLPFIIGIFGILLMIVLYKVGD